MNVFTDAYESFSHILRVCFIGILEIKSVNLTNFSDIENLCTRSRYQGQGQVITPHKYCVV